MLHSVQKRGGVPPSSFGQSLAVAAIALIAALLLLAFASGLVRAQDATPALVPPGDPRSEGEGPGFGGGPLFAAAVVVGLGVVAALATLVYVRLLRRR